MHAASCRIGVDCALTLVQSVFEQIGRVLVGWYMICSSAFGLHRYRDSVLYCMLLSLQISASLPIVVVATTGVESDSDQPITQGLQVMHSYQCPLKASRHRFHTAPLVSQGLT